MAKKNQSFEETQRTIQTLRDINASLGEDLKRSDHANQDLRLKLQSFADRNNELETKLEQAGQRSKLPETRSSITHKIEVTTKDGVVDVYVIIGFYESGLPGEIFVRCSAMGSTVSGFIDSWSIAVSLLLQHGVTLEKIVEKFAYAKFEPLGYAKCGDVKFQATSLVDAIVRLLEMRYLKKKEENQ